MKYLFQWLSMHININMDFSHTVLLNSYVFFPRKKRINQLLRLSWEPHQFQDSNLCKSCPSFGRIKMLTFMKVNLIGCYCCNTYHFMSGRHYSPPLNPCLWGGTSGGRVGWLDICLVTKYFLYILVFDNNSETHRIFAENGANHGNC